MLPVLVGNVRVMVSGDSIAGGQGVTCGPRRAMHDWANANTDVHIDFVGSQTDSACAYASSNKHEGHGGFTIANLAANIAGYLAANPPEILILVVGVNDCKASGGYRTAAQMIADYRTLLVAARMAKPDVRILASEVIPPNGSVNAEYAAASRTAQEFNALLPGLVAEFPDDTVRIGRNGRYVLDQNDGLHPDIVVYLLMAWFNLREIWSWLSARPPAATDAGILRFNPYIW